MGDTTLNILLIEQDEIITKRVESVLGGSAMPPCQLERHTNLADGLVAMSQSDFDLILLDLNLPDSSGFEAFLRTLAARPDADVIVLVPASDKELAERVVRAGARDSLVTDRIQAGYLANLIRNVAAGAVAKVETEATAANYRAIFDAVNDAILVLGLDSDEVVDINQPGLKMFGYPRDRALALRVADLSSGAPPFTGQNMLRFLQMAALGEPQIFEWQAKRADGSVFWVELNLKLAEVGGDERLLAVVRDISARKNAEADNLRLAAFPRESPYPILECDKNGFPIYVNPAARAEQERLGVDLSDLLAPNHTDIIAGCLNNQSRTGDVEVLVKESILVWTYQPVPSVGVVHLYAQDITQRHRAEERLLQNAMQDTMTGLPNRALLMDRLERNLDLLKRHEDYHFALLLLDLDRFKMVNESLGHDAGDQLLHDVTERLNHCVKQSDTVARTGGDEFVLLLEDIGNAANVSRIADRIQKEFALPFSVGGREVYVSASMGITLGDAAASSGTPAALLQDAETAMYRAKREGKGRYTVFDEALQARGAALLQLETDFRAGLDRREFLTYYQPILSIHSGGIIGFEALVRWQHPERGLLTPYEFIGMAEDTGLIEPMADQVIEAACERCNSWRRGGHPQLQASVNLSGLQFRHEDLAERILTTVVRCGLEPRALKVEVTESIAAGDLQHTIATLERFRELGIGVMIDDFGTGYSSLGYLKRFPVDYIKIDRTFVMDVTTDTDSAAIVTTIILMAHALGFEVVAEGVETEGQLEFLRNHRCEYAQGYLFSRPVPDDQFAALLENGVPFGARPQPGA